MQCLSSVHGTAELVIIDACTCTGSYLGTRFAVLVHNHYVQHYWNSDCSVRVAANSVPVLLKYLVCGLPWARSPLLTSTDSPQEDKNPSPLAFKDTPKPSFWCSCTRHHMLTHSTT